MMETAKGNGAKTMIVSFQELLASLPDHQKNGKLIKELKACYEYEVATLMQYARRAKKPFVALLPFNQSGVQFIADFWVDDLSIPEKEQYNWHGQNVSQWLYAGCICVQDGKVSTHH